MSLSEGLAEIPFDQLEGFGHRMLEVAGSRLHVVEGGDPAGPAVVLLAGFPQSWFAWREVMADLAHHYRVIAFDLPGQGHSDRPPTGYDTATVTATIRAAVAGLDLGAYWLVAHDIGAWVAMPYALQGDEPALRGVVLLDAGIPGVSLPESIPTDPDRAYKLAHFAFHVVPDLPETLITGREREYVAWFLSAKSATPGAFTGDDLDRYARLLAADGGLPAMLAYYRAAGISAAQNRELIASGRRIPVPVLAVSSDQGSIPDMAAALRPAAGDIRGVRIPGAGHFIPEEQPRQLAKELREFFATTTS
jgi:pimeloyl-ACP methyl ester carboxylesterase